jgi:tripartite-type tricarboxylate transporter receptor subunit TctC
MNPHKGDEMRIGLGSIRSAVRFIAGLLLLAGGACAFAQYPERPVKIVFPFAAGGSGDNIHRLFAQKLSERTGKPFVVENKTGAGGRIAYDAVAKSRPDGYTLVGVDPGYAVLRALYGKLSWDHANDLVPVTMYARTPFAIVVSPQSRFKTMRELLEYAQANPGKLTFGTPGTGSIGHVVFETMLREAKVTMTHVPYRGGSEALAAVMGNSIDLMVTGAPTITGHMKSGRVTVLAVTSQERWAAGETVPTLVEQGVNVVSYLWVGLMAPKGTPQPVIDYLHRQVVAILQDPAMKDALQAQGVQGAGLPAVEVGRQLREDGKVWEDVVRAAKISTD